MNIIAASPKPSTQTAGSVERVRVNQAIRVASEHRGRKLELFRQQNGFWFVWIQSVRRNKGKIHYPGYRSEHATQLFAESLIDAELEEAHLERFTKDKLASMEIFQKLCIGDRRILAEMMIKRLVGFVLRHRRNGRQ